MGRTEFSDQFRKMIIHKRIGYDVNVMQQSACLVINPITCDSFAAFFNCMPVDLVSGPKMASTLSYFGWLEPELFVCCLVRRGSIDDLLLLQFSSDVV